MIDQKLLDILVCPQCKGHLEPAEAHLTCTACQLKYPVQGGVPIMLVEEALDLRKHSQKIDARASGFLKTAFRVIEGVDKGLKFEIEHAACRAIGRGEADPDMTTMFNVDLAMTLDEGTKTLVLKYIAKQFKKPKLNGTVTVEERLGMFKRTSDIVLSDHSLSRLHAMVFASENQVGILDLVSKNGTFVNGLEIESKLLKKGDIIEMGETKIVFEG